MEDSKKDNEVQKLKKNNQVSKKGVVGVVDINKNSGEIKNKHDLTNN